MNETSAEIAKTEEQKVDFIPNHRNRKYNAKMIQKKEGTYRKIRRNEAYNFNTWFERIRRAKEYGRQVAIINEEAIYNYNVRFYENLEKQKKEFLQNTFKDDKIYNNFVALLAKSQEKSEKRQLKKFNK